MTGGGPARARDDEFDASEIQQALAATQNETERIKKSAKETGGGGGGGEDPN